MEPLSIGKSGVQETALTSTATFVIPDANDGNRAKRIAIRVVTAAETMYALPVSSSGAPVTAETGLPIAKETPVILNVTGYTRIAALRAGSTDVVFNMTPIEF